MTHLAQDVAEEGAGTAHGGLSYPRQHSSARLTIVTCTNALARPPAADRILALRLGAVGDVVRTLPAASALRAAYPGSHLAWLVEPASRSLLEGQPWIDEVLVFPRPELRAALREGRAGAAARILRRFVRDLRAQRFDLTVDFHAILKSALLARASGAPERVTYARPYAREGAWLFATRCARISARRASRFDRNAALVQFLGAEPMPLAHPLRLEAAALARARAALGPGSAPVALHPGSSDRTPHKRWLLDGYATLAKALAKHEGIPSVVTHGPARHDRSFAEAVVAASEGTARLAPETPGLADLAALFSLCRLYVGSDTGPMHIASLVGTPVVQILGPTDPLENTPYPGTASRSVRVPVACSPCRRGCAAATCMRLVPPEAVIAATRELLASREARG